MTVIYSNDPRGVHQAIKEELKKDPNAQIQLKKAPKIIKKEIEVFDEDDVLTEYIEEKPVKKTNIKKKSK